MRRATYLYTAAVLALLSATTTAAASTATEDVEPSTTTCHVCTACTSINYLAGPRSCAIDSIDHGDPYLRTIPTEVWTSIPSIPLTPTAIMVSDSTTPSDHARPICQDVDSAVGQDLRRQKVPDGFRTPDGRDTGLRTILHDMADDLCRASDTGSQGMYMRTYLAWRYMTVTNSGRTHELAVGLTNETELYVQYILSEDMRWYAPEQQKECIDDFDHVLDSCTVKEGKVGRWMNSGSLHSYEVGIRAKSVKRDGSDSSSRQSSAWLWPPTEGLTCNRDCCGRTLNSAWCEAKCQNSSCDTMQERDVDKLRPNTSWRVSDIGGCPISYTLPGSPDMESVERLGRPVYYTYLPSLTRDGQCDVGWAPHSQSRHLPKLDVQYDVDQVFESHMIKRFFYWVLGGWLGPASWPIDLGADTSADLLAPISICNDMLAVFNTRSDDKNSSFHQETAAQRIANALSCHDLWSDTCPDNSRIHEFILLQREMRLLKHGVMSLAFYRMEGAQARWELPACDPRCNDFDQQIKKMFAMHVTFSHMKHWEVARQYNEVRSRIRQVLIDLDRDQLGRETPPRNFHRRDSGPSGDTWLAVFDEFNRRYLSEVEEVARQWAMQCKAYYIKRLLDEPDRSPEIRDALFAEIRKDILPFDSMSRILTFEAEYLRAV